MPKFRSRKTGALALAGATLLALPATAAAVDAPGVTELVSVSSGGEQGNSGSNRPSISDDGRYVAFQSGADNLVSDDTNGVGDVFVRDRLTGRTERASVSSNGHEGDDVSGTDSVLGGPSISADGRYVAFESNAPNLVNQDQNLASDIFVHDRLTDETTRVSVTSGGIEADDNSSSPAISADGRYVAFISRANNLDPAEAFAFRDLFVHDRQTGVTERISEAPDGSPADGESFSTPQLSGDGSLVYFTSNASNLVRGVADPIGSDAFLYNRDTDTMEAITSERGTGASVAEDISADGDFLTFTTSAQTFAETDTNGFAEDAWLVDTQTGDYTRVSLNDAEVQADEFSFAGPVSDDGRYVAFVSRGTNLGGPTNARENVYLRDVVLGTTSLVSQATDGTLGDLRSQFPAMTPDGRQIAFTSDSRTFVQEENQDFAVDDVFVRDLRPAADLKVSMTDSPDPALERDQVTYTVTVDNLGPGKATNTTLVDTLPADPTFVSADPSQGSCVRDVNSNSGGVLTCDLGGIEAGDQATVTIVLEPRSAGVIGNSATADSFTPDDNIGNNTADATTTVTPR